MNIALVVASKIAKRSRHSVSRPTADPPFRFFFYETKKGTAHNCGKHMSARRTLMLMTAVSLPAEGAHVVELLVVPLAVSEEVLDVIEVSGAPERERSQQWR